MTIQQATKEFEKWLGEQIALNPAHLALKHKQMAEDSHAFLRATFYRWMQVWGEVCSGVNNAPKVLAVGDLHADNFGTWCDTEGRLVWGINDFDEAYTVPYTVDLVRLAASVALAYSTDKLAIKPKSASEAILAGYTVGLKAGGEPFVLAEKHPWLAEIAQARLREPSRFWQKLESFPRIKGVLPPSVRKALDKLLPEPGIDGKIVYRVSGLGSLGRQRYVMIADWHGGKIAREAKAMAPSACVWALHDKNSRALHYQTLLDQTVRCRDPFVRLEGAWIVRRLSPNCSRIELVTLPKNRDEYRILYGMGWETANIHLGSPKTIASVLRDLNKRPSRWLRQAARAMVKATRQDWLEWRINFRRAP